MTEASLAHKNFISGRLLAKNTLWNLFGQGAPLLAAVFAIPILIERLGTERYGVLTLAWMVIGYFSLFDLGLGRALTKLTADRIGVGKEEEIQSLAWTALGVMLALSLVGVLAVCLLSPWLVHRALKIPSELQADTLRAFYWLGWSIPVVIGTSGLRGLLEAYQRFGLVNAIRIPMGLFTFLGPLLVLPFSRSLTAVVAVLVVGRTLAWAAHALLCLRVIPGLCQKVSLAPGEIKPLLAFGGWMTVSNVAGPLMVYLDRFLIGAVLSMAAVAYYATPYELVTKLWIFPTALLGVLFPAFAASLAQSHDQTASLFGQGLKGLFLSLFPIVLVMVVVAEEGLTLWLGAEFAKNSIFVFQWLSIGVFLNCLAQVSFALIQSAGRPDITAKLHLLELPFYLLVLWWAMSEYGLKGTAIAWVLRIFVDMLALNSCVKKILPQCKIHLNRLSFATMVSLGVLITGTMIHGFVQKIIYLIVVLFVFLIAIIKTIYRKNNMIF